MVCYEFVKVILTIKIIQRITHVFDCAFGCVGHDGIPVRMPDSHLREPSFKSHCGCIKPLPSLITPRCHSSLSCINEYLAVQTVVEI